MASSSSSPSPPKVAFISDSSMISATRFFEWHRALPWIAQERLTGSVCHHPVAIAWRAMPWEMRRWHTLRARQ
jgi:hypothetical protein